MKEVLKTLGECTPGEVVAQDVIDLKTGTTLCKAGYTLTRDSIRWFSNFECSPIFTRQTSWDSVWELGEETVQQYAETKEKVAGLLDNLAKDKILDHELLHDVGQHFQDYMNTNMKILGCINLIKELDEYTHTHSMNVGMLSVLIGRWMGLDKEVLDELFLAGVLHDAGKYRVDPVVLQKPGNLSREEYGVAKKHVLYGYDLLKDVEGLSEAIKMGVLTHHERIDGTGYPRALKGEGIHLFGRIIAIADMYDAMLSKRVYKERQMPFAVMEKMMNEGIGKVDTEILLTFLSHIANYYVGVYVELSTGQTGKVIFIHSHCVHRPIIEVDDEYIDLEVAKNIEIVDIV